MFLPSVHQNYTFYFLNEKGCYPSFIKRDAYEDEILNNTQLVKDNPILKEIPLDNEVIQLFGSNLIGSIQQH